MEPVPLLAPDVGVDGIEIRVTTRRGGVSQAPTTLSIWAITSGCLALCWGKPAQGLGTAADPGYSLDSSGTWDRVGGGGHGVCARGGCTVDL